MNVGGTFSGGNPVPTRSRQQAANDSAVEEELGLIGATAEDTEAELIRKICETELLAGKNTLFIGALTTSVPHSISKSFPLI